MWARAMVVCGLCAGCVEQGDDAGPLAGDVDYLGVQTRLLSEDLVSILVAAGGGATEMTVEDYAKCAAAQYAVIRGFGFARHVRTLVAEEGGIWRADAVYTISSALPQGALTLDAEITVADCQLRGVPTV